KSTGKPFVVRWWANDYIVMPPKYLNDVRGASWRHLSFFENISNALHLHRSVGDLYTVDSSQRMVDVVKKGLNPRIPQLTTTLVQEIDYALNILIGTSSEWKDIQAMELLAEVAHRAATRVLIGEELCRDDAFIRQSMSFLESIFVTALVITKLPLGPFRSLLSRPISFIHRGKLHKCMNMLRPLVNARMEEKDLHAIPKKLDAIQWTLDLFPDTANNSDQDRFLKELLHNLWAGSSAPGGMMTEVIWQLLLNFQNIEVLRKEASEALHRHGWSEKMLNSLHLQDSFIRETNRLFPTGSITCVRTVVGKPFQFSDGLILPAGTRFGFPAQAIQHDHDALRNPSEFDGFRFAGKNTKDISVTDGDKREGASSVDKSYFPWGYGNHVCPGRFFAVRLMKLVITKLILEYDIKWDRKTKDRPIPVHVEGQFVPNMDQKIHLRKCTAL
ncbi:cytochrome P450 monooxygenase, partial [Melanomma pulvis-pyrius CBS 109.77]